MSDKGQQNGILVLDRNWRTFVQDAAECNWNYEIPRAYIPGPKNTDYKTGYFSNESD